MIQDSSSGTEFPKSKKTVAPGSAVMRILGLLSIVLIVLNGSLVSGSKTNVIDAAADRNPEGQIPILMYHEVADETWGLEGLFVKISDFEDQMKYLYDNGYQTLFMKELLDQSSYHKKVILTFDDGYRGFYTNVMPVLEKYNIKANLYVMSGGFGGPYISVEQLTEIHQSGLVQIGSHSKNHSDLTTLSQTKAEEEIRESKEMLESILRTEITSFAYPYGAYDLYVLEAVKLHYSEALGTKKAVAVIDESTLYYQLPRIGIYRSTTIQSFMDICLMGR
jgi:peptidoglycan/xylan/chitin deacetylase (PgdA/CDA1 family)